MGPVRPATLPSDGWSRTRDWIGEHFDGRSRSWRELTSDAPLGRIRSTVRAGRRRMQETILSWLDAEGRDETVLDAGCGPGPLTLALARRGYRVVGADISAELVEVARERAAEAGLEDRIRLAVEDMLAVPGAPFDHVVAMDSFLHYTPEQLPAALERMGTQARRTFVFTYAPRTAFLAVMHAVGTLLPARNRSPHITPLPHARLQEGLDRLATQGWRTGRSYRVSSGFYISQAQEMVRDPNRGPEVVG